MIKNFLSKIRSRTVGRVLTRLVLLVWAIACGANAYDGQYLDAAAFFVGGLLIMQYMDEVENARLYFSEIEEKNEIWLKALDRGDSGVTVIGAGTLHDMLRCFCAMTKFISKTLAEHEDDDFAVGCFHDTFEDMIETYCEDKGIDKGDFAKRVGFHRVD